MATVIFQLEGTTYKTPDLLRKSLCNASEILRILISGDFAESSQNTITIKPSDSLDISDIHSCVLWVNFWIQVCSDKPEFSDLTTQDVCIMGELCDIYEISTIIDYLQQYIMKNNWPITNETISAACEIDAIELLLSNSTEIDNIPNKLVELFEPDDALKILVKWQRKLTERSGYLHFMNITNATWPTALGAPLITNTDIILEQLSKMMAVSKDALVSFMKTHPEMSIAGGATLDVISSHEIRGKGASDVDIWASCATNEQTFEKFRNEFIEFIQGPENKLLLVGRNNAVINFASIGNPHNIQLINCVALDLEEILSNFDIPAVHIGICWDLTTDSLKILCSADFIYCMITGIIPWTDAENMQPYRLEKYKRKGFTFINEKYTALRKNVEPLQVLEFNTIPKTSEEACTLCHKYYTSYNEVLIITSKHNYVCDSEFVSTNDAYGMSWKPSRDKDIKQIYKYGILTNTNLKFDSGYVKFQEHKQQPLYCLIELSPEKQAELAKIYPKYVNIIAYNPTKKGFHLNKYCKFINVYTGEISKKMEINEGDEIRIMGNFWKLTGKEFDCVLLIGNTILVKPFAS